jgi:large subunit ribosomal protein L23
VDDYSIIIRPLITEQGIHFANNKGAYSFQVHKSANKIQIRQAIERIYGVKVDKVRTANRSGKLRKRGKAFGRTASWKKAIVYLDAEYHIDLF